MSWVRLKSANDVTGRKVEPVFGFLRRKRGLSIEDLSELTVEGDKKGAAVVPRGEGGAA